MTDDPKKEGTTQETEEMIELGELEGLFKSDEKTKSDDSSDRDKK